MAGLSIQEGLPLHVGVAGLPPSVAGTGIAGRENMFIENGNSGIAGFLDLAVIPIKTVLVGSPKASPIGVGARRIALMEEAGGVSVEKLLLSGGPAAVRSKAIEMIKAGRKMVLEGFPLEEVAAWCFRHNYRWRFHHDSSSQNSFILEPGKKICSEAKPGGESRATA